MRNEDKFETKTDVTSNESLNFDGDKLISEQDFEILTKNLDNLPGTKLPKEIANTFQNGEYYNRKLSSNEIFYKYHGINNRTGKKYSWLTNKKYSSEAELRVKLAIREDWGVKIESITEFNVPAGTWISEGKAASQGVAYPGGDYQVVILNLPKSWIIKTTNAF